jgi:hypothetical protein
MFRLDASSHWLFADFLIFLSSSQSLMHYTAMLGTTYMVDMNIGELRAVLVVSQGDADCSFLLDPRSPKLRPPRPNPNHHHRSRILSSCPRLPHPPRLRHHRSKTSPDASIEEASRRPRHSNLGRVYWARPRLPGRNASPHGYRSPRVIGRSGRPQVWRSSERVYRLQLRHLLGP